ncbi:hypothetical protein KOR34_13070 [Posidoniimonas corsicana]|uniref:DUF3592 domain-containing protein n=1 Tax=Posidoniimonas corsicana TaxID=1938618 RepID=A0A5C5VFH6_9BACT|nr:hypothetical protein [Posidoniimonas corsicana]TWT36402.1 hypothetical protein KOR34_13070 [Posidoniimonas corsicana]
MRSRFRLWLKKRGARRSGSPRLALAAELLYHVVFLAVGAVALWLHVQNVLAPEWKVRSDLSGYLPGRCEIIGKKSNPQAGPAGWEYQPECRVQLEQAGRFLPPVWAMAGEPSPHRNDSDRTLQKFEVGSQAPCWYDPADTSRVTLTQRRRWWPWLVTLIPFSLIVLGVVGVTRSFLRAGISPERRQSVAQRAGRLEAVLAPASGAVVGAGLPDTSQITDSPGVRLKYRLPSLGDSGWRIATLATICVAWNLLVVFFLSGLGLEFWRGRPQWALLLAIVPLAIGGVYMVVLLYHEARSSTGIGLTSVEVSDHPFYPGGSYRGQMIQTGQFKFRGLTVSLVCDEVATFCEGTDTRTSVQEVYRQVVLQEPRGEVITHKPLERAFSFQTPADAMHSFKAPHNEVRWFLEVRVTPLRWPSFRRSFLVCVFPPAVASGIVQAAPPPSPQTVA